MCSWRALFSPVFLTAFSSFLFTPQMAVPTASPRRQHQPCNRRHHEAKKTLFYTVCDIVTELWHGERSLIFHYGYDYEKTAIIDQVTIRLPGVEFLWVVHSDHACVNLAPLRRYGASKIMGSRVWLFRLRDVIGHVTIRLPAVDFLWVVHSDHASI